ncbi:Rv0361 family membrane protein [Nocardioides pelophilus]|uniref:Rv0361 family membrane protein n=1 Tax=Nocardioides pelophilus TaxID=2172019 RepID=UPI001FE90F22|nr:hypothetical protein [Nocardioides pelophilus]
MRLLVIVGASLVVLVVVAVSALAITGVIGGKSAEETAEAVADAYSDGDWAEVCEFFSDEARERAFDEAGVDDCDGYAESAAEEAEGLVATMKIVSVKEDGDEATAKVRISVGVFSETDELYFIRDGGDWKLDDDRDPEPEEIAGALEDSGGLSEEDAECAAVEILDADLSDEQLEAIVEDDESGLDEEELEEVTEAITDAVADCAG